MTPATETLHVKDAWTTQDGIHFPIFMPRSGIAGFVSTPRLLTVGETIKVIHGNSGWRFVQAATIEASDRP